MSDVISPVSAALSGYARSRHPEPPRHLGTRYDPSGTFLPEPGNTIVCHLVPGSETERALVAARSAYLAMPEAGQLAFTPVSSLHMTLFQGILEGRRLPPYWPADIAPDTPIDRMTELFEARLARLTPGPAFAVRVVEALPTGLVVEGAGRNDQRAMQLWRDRFADLLGYRHPDHDGYVFHITFAYMISWLDDAVLPAWQDMLSEVLAHITRRAPVLELRPPAFCSFADMNHFEERLVLRPAGD